MDLLEHEIVSGRSAPCPRQITTPPSHYWVFTGQGQCSSCNPSISIKALKADMLYVWVEGRSGLEMDEAYLYVPRSCLRQLFGESGQAVLYHVETGYPTDYKVWAYCLCWWEQRAKQLMQKKEEGNSAFKVGKTEEACRIYTEALSIDPNNIYTNSKLYFNRATVCSKVTTTFTSFLLSLCCYVVCFLELLQLWSGPP